MNTWKKHSVSRLIGAPPGYVGYDEGGKLTETVRRNPYSVILFDEVEKAHRDVLNILLQILDEGHVTDSQGRKVDFKNAIIIMTSNIASHHLLNCEKIDKPLKELILKELQKEFKPEFLNRIDEIVLFSPLDKEQVREILDLLFKDISKRLLKEKGIKITLSNKAKGHIIESGYDLNYGARPVKRFLQKNIETLIAKAILSDEIKKWK